jgi:hypothetical protein
MANYYFITIMSPGNIYHIYRFWSHARASVLVRYRNRIGGGSCGTYCNRRSSSAIGPIVGIRCGSTTDICLQG